MKYIEIMNNSLKAFVRMVIQRHFVSQHSGAKTKIILKHWSQRLYKVHLCFKKENDLPFSSEALFTTKPIHDHAVCTIWLHPIGYWQVV